MLVKPSVTFQFQKDENLYMLVGPNGTSYQNYIEALNAFAEVLSEMSKQSEAQQELPQEEVSDGV